MNLMRERVPLSRRRGFRLFQSSYAAALGLLLGAAAIPAPAADEEPTADEKYVRFVEQDDGSGGLQTANASFVRAADGVRVDLLSVVHIADADYFEKFNQAFSDYDRVLFELVGDPEGLHAYQAEGAEKRRGSALSGMQAAAANALDLTFQMDVVDYSAENLVHADMDGGTFRDRQRERGQGFLQLYLKAVRASMSNPQLTQSSIGLLDLAEAMISDDRPNRLKWLIAGEFSNTDELIAALESDGGTVIIGERNAVAIEVLEKQIEAGDRRLAIFYGGGHMGDFEQRLTALGFKPEGKEWWTAWQLKAPVVRETSSAPAVEEPETAQDDE